MSATTTVAVMTVFSAHASRALLNAFISVNRWATFMSSTKLKNSRYARLVNHPKKMITAIVIMFMIILSFQCFNEVENSFAVLRYFGNLLTVLTLHHTRPIPQISVNEFTHLNINEIRDYTWF
jgi:uncharacterized membrane protein